MIVPTFDQMRQLIDPIWQEERYQPDILWAGIFGSVSRNRARVNSDVDILIVMKEGLTGEPVDLREKLAEACGREISLMCIWQEPDWAWGHVRIEALLSSRTVYGNRADVEHLRRDAMTILDDGLSTLDLTAEPLKRLQLMIAPMEIHETGVDPDLSPVSDAFVQELTKVIDILDIQPLHHPIRTMLNPYIFIRAGQLRARLNSNIPDVDPGKAANWKIIWNKLRSTSVFMDTFVNGCMGGQKYIRHMLASKRLADSFEEGRPVDESMYSEILR